MSSVESVRIEDHSVTLRNLKDWLEINSQKTAVITVDMHRGHLDPVEATLPVSIEESQRVLRHAKEILTFSREREIPVIHVIHVNREIGIELV